MGQILGSKVTNNGEIIFTISMDHEEALQLRGHIDKVHLFSEKIANIKTNLSMRGTNSATKYFLIPRQLRRNIKFNGNVSCQRIDTKSKVIFIYIVDKHQF